MEEKFQAAVSIVQKMPKTGPMVPTNDEKLMFYSLYKQATEVFDFYFNLLICREAWKKLGEMSSDEAKKKYIDLVKQTINEMSRTMNVSEWLQQIDPTLSEKLDLIIAE
ncbi:unnamed protein product [Brugia pahangi]|uniref:ACB domain-containing protein n=1 Tax=Brugia pahangi TaxID=6280 RepID=A0A0N4T218_BRUPA|nr:unnamed protein product [Brugia pahangi]